MVPFLALVLPLLVAGGEPSIGDHMHTPQPQEILTNLARGAVEGQVQTFTANVTSGFSYNFTNSSGDVLARIGLDGPLIVDLMKTTCMGKVVGGQCCADKTSSDTCTLPGTQGKVVADVASAVSFPLNGTATTSVVTTGAGPNLTHTLTLDLTKLELNQTAHPKLTLTGAQLVLVVTPEGQGEFPYYWNVSSASLKLQGQNNSVALPAVTDIAPAVAFSKDIQPACTAPYGICAPAGLTWTCDDQIMAAPSSVVNSTHYSTFGKAGDLVAVVHMTGLVLRLGNDTEQFNWDCEPLIPISVWVSVLITLFLASILLWGLYMLATLQTPDKFDDPKGPSIHVPTSE